MSKGITRGSGLLEKFLAGQRVNVANRNIIENSREGKVLDVGCGSLPFFLLNTNFKEKYGVDPNVDATEAQNNMNLYNIVLSGNNSLPFDNDFFDVITMLAVFEHLEIDILVNILSEIYRVLRPGRRFILTTPHLIGDKLLHFMATCYLVSKEEIEEHKGIYTHAQIADYLKKAGFSQEKMQYGRFELWLNNWLVADK